jgi:hypothetical protein
MLTTRTTIALALASALLAWAPGIAGAEPKDVPPFVATPAPAQDLRSPDTRDAAEGRGTWSVPDVTVVTLREPAPAAEHGIDWGDAGIGAGTVFGVIAVGLGGTFAIVYRRRRDPRTAAAA